MSGPHPGEMQHLWPVLDEAREERDEALAEVERLREAVAERDALIRLLPEPRCGAKGAVGSVHHAGDEATTCTLPFPHPPDREFHTNGDVDDPYAPQGVEQVSEWSDDECTSPSPFATNPAALSLWRTISNEGDGEPATTKENDHG